MIDGGGVALVQAGGWLEGLNWCFWVIVGTQGPVVWAYVEDDVGVAEDRNNG